MDADAQQNLRPDCNMESWLCLQDGKGMAQLTKGRLTDTHFTLFTTTSSAPQQPPIPSPSIMPSAGPSMAPSMTSQGPGMGTNVAPGMAPQSTGTGTGISTSMTPTPLSYLSAQPPHPLSLSKPSNPEVIAHEILFNENLKVSYKALALSASVPDVSRSIQSYIECLLSNKLLDYEDMSSQSEMLAERVSSFCKAVLSFTSLVLDNQVLISMHRLISLLGSIDNQIAENLKLEIVDSQQSAQQRLSSCLATPSDTIDTSTSGTTSGTPWTPYISQMMSLEAGIPFELFMASGFVEQFADQLAIFHRKYWQNWSPLVDPSLLFHEMYACESWMNNPLVFDNSKPHFLAYLLCQHVFNLSISNKVRAKLLENWIRLASLLRDRGDSVGWIGIIVTLFSPPLLRLTTVWWFVDTQLVTKFANDWGFETFELHKRSEIPFLQKKSFRTDTENVGKTYSKMDCVPYFNDAINFDNVDEISPLKTERKLKRIQLICEGWNGFINSVNDLVGPSEVQPDLAMQTVFGKWAQQPRPSIDFKLESLDVKPRVLGHYLPFFYSQPLPLTNAGLLPIFFAEDQNLFRIYPRKTLLLANQPKSSSSRPKVSVRRSSSFPPLSYPVTTGISELDSVSREQLELAASAHILVHVVKDLLNVGTEQIDTKYGIVFKTVPTDVDLRSKTRTSSIVESKSNSNSNYDSIDGKLVVVKSANLVRLVDVMVLGADAFCAGLKLNIDLHMETLLATYRNMYSPVELLEMFQNRLVCARYAANTLAAATTDGGSTEALNIDDLWHHSKDTDKVNELASHIVQTLLTAFKKWIENYFFDFMDDSNVLDFGQLLLNSIRNEIVNHGYPDELLAKCRRLHGAFYHHQFSLTGLTKGLPSWYPLLASSTKSSRSQSHSSSASVSGGRLVPELPCHFATMEERVQAAISYIDELNVIVNDAFSRITIIDWVQLGEVLQLQTVSPTGLFTSSSMNHNQPDSETVIQDVYYWLCSLVKLDTRSRLLDALPETVVALIKLHMGLVSYLTLQFAEPKSVLPQERKERMMFAHIMLGVLRSRMKFFDLFPECDAPAGQQAAQHVPSFLERSLIAAITRPESRAHVSMWLAAGSEIARYFNPIVPFKGHPNEEAIFIPEIPTTRGEPLSPCIGWIIERILEIVSCVPNLSLDHPNQINFDKQRYSYNLISNLFTEFQPQLPVNCPSQLVTKHSYLFSDAAKFADLRGFLVDRKQLKESIQKEGKTRNKVFTVLLSQEHERQSLETRQLEKFEKARSSNFNSTPSSSHRPSSSNSFYGTSGSESSVSIYSKRFSKLMPSSSSSHDVSNLSHPPRHSASRSQVSISGPIGGGASATASSGGAGGSSGSGSNMPPVPPVPSGPSGPSGSSIHSVPSLSSIPPVPPVPNQAINTAPNQSGTGKKSPSPNPKKSRFGGFFKSVRPLSVLGNSISHSPGLPHSSSQRTINSLADKDLNNSNSADVEWVADDSITIDSLNPTSSVAHEKFKIHTNIDLSSVSNVGLVPSSPTEPNCKFLITHRTGNKKPEVMILRTGSEDVAKAWVNALTLNVNNILLHSTRVFGVPLEIVCKRENTLIPTCLETLLSQIEYRGLDEVGVYRIPGSLAAVNGLKQAFDMGVRTLESNDPRWSDINAVAGCIKLYLRELPQPIFTSNLLPEFSSLAKPSGIILEDLKHAIYKLPACNYAVLKRLIVHLATIVQHSDVNKMNLQNIVIVFGVNFLPPMAVTQMGIMQQILSALILQKDQLFDK